MVVQQVTHWRNVMRVVVLILVYVTQPTAMQMLPVTVKSLETLVMPIKSVILLANVLLSRIPHHQHGIQQQEYSQQQIQVSEGR